MEKPDLKSIMLEMGEENAKVLIKSVIRPYAEWYILNSENKIDDIILPFMQKLEDALLGLAEQINPDDNPPAAA